MSIVNEEWRDIAGYEGYYQVSSLGRVRSCDRVVQYYGQKDRLKKGKLLKLRENSYGYYRVTLTKFGAKSIPVHRLVASAFCPLRDGCDSVNHKNGVKTDNFPHNLEWCTRSENTRHAHKFGLISNSGEKHPKAVFTRDQVLEIRRLRSDGVKFRVIAEMYGVSLSAIAMVVYRHSWAHIDALDC